MSLFKEVVKFINSKLENGQTEFSSKEFCEKTAPFEVITYWKKAIKSPHYRAQTYKTYLKRLGFLSMIKRGQWKILAPIPSWLDSGQVNLLLGYYNYSEYWSTAFKNNQYTPQLHTDFLEQSGQLALRNELKLKLESYMNSINKNQTEFKVGDKVKVIGQCNNHSQPIGSIFTISALFSEASYKYPERGQGWNVKENEFIFRECDLELVKQESQKEKVDNLMRKENLTVREFAEQVIGDGGLPNLYFVTTMPTTNDGEDDVYIDGFDNTNVEVFGPFISYKAALDVYYFTDLHEEDGIGKVIFEDRLTGTLRHKTTVKKVSYLFSETIFND